ncbi:MAG TPA: mannosyltransferase family protein [Acidimicrobiales bacterium]|nr:mannosyltransferase family protein [Acidimicrobiales bacterium]
MTVFTRRPIEPDQRTGLIRWPFATAVLTYLSVRVLTLATVLVADLFTHSGVIRDLSIWDGSWFLKAVEHGWPSQLPMAHGHVLANPVAFFPLLPLTIRALAAATPFSPAVAGLIVSALSGLTAVVAIGRLTEEFAGRQRAERAALLFAVAPGSFVFSLIYAEGLVLTFIALGLVALLRGRWWMAGVLGALASAASPVGLAFAVSCAVVAIVAIYRERAWSALLAPILAPTGFLAWMLYLWAHTHTLQAWRLTERGGWQSYPSLAYPWHIVTQFLFNPVSPTLTGHILFWGTVVSVLGVVVMFREHQPLAVLAYGISAVVMFAVSAPVGLRPRFVMLAFPIIIAAATRWTGWRYRLVLTASALVLALMSFETLSSYAVFP